MLSVYMFIFASYLQTPFLEKEKLSSSIYVLVKKHSTLLSCAACSGWRKSFKK